MTNLFARRALLPEGWTHNVRVAIGETGRIETVESDVSPRPGDTNLGNGLLLPAPANLHSHAFQRAMAGMTEHRSADKDDFWTWRTLMYRFLDVLAPAQIEAIAALVYVEMLEAGYAAVGEFHYVHHQPGGAPYDNIAELSERIFAAVETTGIGLTHLPVLYTYGGAAKAPLTGGQHRFGNDIDRFGKLLDAIDPAMTSLSPDCRLGVAPHSLRAIEPQQLETVTAMRPNMPVHIHAAEQVREVDDVMAWLGARPVEYLLDNAGADERWCLIHATQMTKAETEALAKSGAVAGLCPITEANLGDGIFNGADYLAAGGRFGVGSDSNVRISLTEELRQLEYSQRLKHRARNVLSAGGSVGMTLYPNVLDGGARALGRDSGAIAPGLLADLLAIDGNNLDFCALRDEEIIDGWAFAGDDRAITDVWSAGRHVVREGRHIGRERVERDYRTAMKDLMAAI